jgi:hypothetical protein
MNSEEIKKIKALLRERKGIAYAPRIASLKKRMAALYAHSHNAFLVCCIGSEEYVMALSDNPFTRSAQFQVLMQKNPISSEVLLVLSNRLRVQIELPVTHCSLYDAVLTFNKNVAHDKELQIKEVFFIQQEGSKQHESYVFSVKKPLTFTGVIKGLLFGN